MYALALCYRPLTLRLLHSAENNNGPESLKKDYEHRTLLEWMVLDGHTVNTDFINRFFFINNANPQTNLSTSSVNTIHNREPTQTEQLNTPLPQTKAILSVISQLCGILRWSVMLS